MAKPISIIVPAFNSGAKLGQTLASIFEQPSDLYELIVVDGGSSDGTREILAAFSPEKVKWISEVDSGVYEAMNKGVSMASGQYLYFMGAGDRLRPGALRQVADELRTVGDRCMQLYGDVDDAAGGRNLRGRYSAWRLSRVNICHQAIFYSRSVFDKVGLYDLRYKIVADWVLNMRCFGDRSVEKRYVAITVADYEGEGLSDSRPDAAFLANRLELIRENLGFWPYAVNKLFAALPAGLKEGRYRAWRRWFGVRRKDRATR